MQADYVCMCVCVVYAYLWRCGHTCTHVQRLEKDTGVLLYCLLLCCLETGLSLNLELTFFLLGWLTSKSQRSPYLWPWVTDEHVATHSFDFWCWRFVLRSSCVHSEQPYPLGHLPRPQASFSRFSLHPTMKAETKWPPKPQMAEMIFYLLWADATKWLKTNLNDIHVPNMEINIKPKI